MDVNDTMHFSIDILQSENLWFGNGWTNECVKVRQITGPTHTMISFSFVWSIRFFFSHLLSCLSFVKQSSSKKKWEPEILKPPADLFCGRNFGEKKKYDRNDKCLWRSLLYWRFLHHHHRIILCVASLSIGFLSQIESLFSALWDCFYFLSFLFFHF